MNANHLTPTMAFVILLEHNTLVILSKAKHLLLSLLLLLPLPLLFWLSFPQGICF